VEEGGWKIRDGKKKRGQRCWQVSGVRLISLEKKKRKGEKHISSSKNTGTVSNSSGPEEKGGEPAKSKNYSPKRR